MTMALCLNCGEVKFGAICPCPKCEVASTGDMGMDIAFSDHNLAEETLEELGVVVAAIRKATQDAELGFWAFLVYVTDRWNTIMGLDLEPEFRKRIELLLHRVELPEVTFRDSPMIEIRRNAMRREDQKARQN